MRESEEQTLNKKPLLELKSQLEEKDYRGLIALMIVAGFILMIVICLLRGDVNLLMQVSAVFGSPVSSVLTWYFMSKRK